MDYVSLGFKNKLSGENMAMIKKCAESFNVLIVEEDSEMLDSEIRDGLTEYCFYSGIKLILTFKSKNDKKNDNAFLDVKADLMTFYESHKPSNFLEFLKGIESLIIGSSLIFAFSWEKNDLIRFEKRNLASIEKYFKSNYGWYIWLYDYRYKYSQPNLDIPTVFEILP